LSVESVYERLFKVEMKL